MIEGPLCKICGEKHWGVDHVWGKPVVVLAGVAARYKDAEPVTKRVTEAVTKPDFGLRIDNQRATYGSNIGRMVVRELVGYVRVSTEGQHRSGLGEDAQRRALAEFAVHHGLRLVGDYSDTASGKDPLTKRPGLTAALAEARRRKCPIVVAKLDRLSRDVHFISGLMAEKVPFVVTQFGLDVDPFMLHIYAAVAEKERKLIGERTKAALAGRVRSGESLRKLTLETERAIFDAYSSGVSAVDLAAAHGVTRQAITKAVRRYKVVRLAA
jgi:DNA invertase Pin-like site-specific DNA recombinase